MRAPEFRMFAGEMVVDNFAGAGGASVGNSVCPDVARAIVSAQA